MKFTCEIRMGNDAMSEPWQVADALTRYGAAIEAGDTEGVIQDANGNTVGEWAITGGGHPILNLRAIADEWNEELIDLAKGRGPDGMLGPTWGEMSDRLSKYEHLADQLGIEANPDELLAYALDEDRPPRTVEYDGVTYYTRS